MEEGDDEIVSPQAAAGAGHGRGSRGPGVGRGIRSSPAQAAVGVGRGRKRGSGKPVLKKFSSFCPLVNIVVYLCDCPLV
jgi:hypothetical protein